MKKLCTFLLYSGLAGILCSVLLKLLHVNAYNLLVASHAVIVLAIALFPFLYAGNKKFERLLQRQKIFLVILWVGVLFVTIGGLLRLGAFQIVADKKL